MIPARRPGRHKQTWQKHARRNETAPEPKAPRGPPPAFLLCRLPSGTGVAGRARLCLALLVQIVSSAKAVTPRPGCFSWQWWIRLTNRRLGVAAPAPRPPQPHRPTQVYGPRDHYHRTCQERTVTSFPQPRPACSLPRDGPPESPLNRHGESIRAGVRGVDKILCGALSALPSRT